MSRRGPRSPHVRSQWAADIISVIVRDGNNCHLCGKPVNLFIRKRGKRPMAPSLDHIIPVSKGGTDFLDNLRLAHRKCNMERQAAPNDNKPKHGWIEP